MVAGCSSERKTAYVSVSRDTEDARRAALDRFEDLDDVYPTETTIETPSREPDVAQVQMPVSREIGDSDWCILHDPFVPPTISSSRNSARTVRVVPGQLEMHICWCFGVRVTTYDSTVDWTNFEHDVYTFSQCPDTFNLVITDGVNFVAYFDALNGLTATFAYEGTRSYRFSDWSVYFFSNGRIQSVLTGNRQYYFMQNWGIVDGWETTSMPMQWAELLRIDQMFMARLLTQTLPLDWRAQNYSSN